MVNNLEIEFGEFKEEVNILGHRLKRLLEHKGNTYYKEKYNKTFIDVDKKFKIISKMINLSNDDNTKKKFSVIGNEMEEILTNADHQDSLNRIKNLPFMYNDFEICFMEQPTIERLPKVKITNVPKEIIREVNLDLQESLKCISSKAYRSSIIMSARSLEVCLHRIYFEATGKDLLDSGLGIGKLIGKLREENIQLFPGINQVFNLANECRIESVHKKKHIFLPQKTDSVSIFHLVNNCINRLWNPTD